MSRPLWAVLRWKIATWEKPSKEGCFHNMIMVSIRKSYPEQAKKVMSAIWGLGQMMFSKCIIVLDDDANIQDLKEVTWRTTNNVDPMIILWKQPSQGRWMSTISG